MFANLKRKNEDHSFGGQSLLKKSHTEFAQRDRETIQKQRRELPIASARSKFLEQTHKNDCFVLIGKKRVWNSAKILQLLT